MPPAWKQLLEASVQRLHENSLGLKTGYSELRGKRVCTDIVRRTSRASKTSKDGARLVVANAWDAVWTRKRAQQAGYVVEDTRCELCGAHEDTIHGRVWKC